MDRFNRFENLLTGRALMLDLIPVFSNPEGPNSKITRCVHLHVENSSPAREFDSLSWVHDSRPLTLGRLTEVRRMEWIREGVLSEQ